VNRIGVPIIAAGGVQTGGHSTSFILSGKSQVYSSQLEESQKQQSRIQDGIES